MADDIELTVPGERELTPAKLHNGVIVDFIDLGVVEEVWEGKATTKRKCKYILELEAKRTDGKQFNIGTRRFTATLGERAKLEEFVRDVTGKSRLSEADRKAFKAKSLVGTSVQVLVKHAEANNGKTYANIAAIMPGGGYKGSGKYVRWVPKNDAKPAAPAPVAEEQIPF